VLLLLLCAVAAGACAPAFALRVPGAQIDWRRVAAGPAIVSVFEFEGSGSLTPRADWTYSAVRNVDEAVTARITGLGGRAFVPDDVAHTDVPYGDFRRWSSRALQEIAGKIAGTRASPHRSVAAWRFPDSLTTLRAALRADFVLAVLFIDAYEPAAGAAGTAPATARYRAAQTGIACLVDLADGRVVACESAPRPFGDLRSRDAARDAVADIVAPTGRS
jgi:hypothetical protein